MFVFGLKLHRLVSTAAQCDISEPPSALKNEAFLVCNDIKEEKAVKT